MPQAATSRGRHKASRNSVPGRADGCHTFSARVKRGNSTGKNPIPQAFFRICFRISGGTPSEVKAFYVPNHPNISKDADTYRTSVDEIEAETGLDFFAELENQAFESYR